MLGGTVIAILTDFYKFEPAYSLCRVAALQARMLAQAGYETVVIGKPGFEGFEGAEVRNVDPGKTSNEIRIDDNTAAEIGTLTNQLKDVLQDDTIVLTHDVIYQRALWKYRVACRRIAKEKPGIKWLHWVHSGTARYDPSELREYRYECEGPSPNATLVAFHDEERMRKGLLFSYEQHNIVTVPNPIDITDSYHPVAMEAIDRGNLWDADVIAVYPCRLDRGKQPHIIVEVFAELAAMGYDVRVVFVDFHSTGGDKVDYRNEIKRLARNVPILFTSDLEFPEAEYHIPHKAVMDLIEFSDVFIQPSVSEGDPLVWSEAAWKCKGLVGNFDLPVHRLWQGDALLYKFSSSIDVTTGLPGDTTTGYGDRQAYMRHVAGGIAYQMRFNPVLKLHAETRKRRAWPNVWRKWLWPLIEGC